MEELSTRRFDLWQYYMKDVPAPQDFLDFGFYWMISACLQRRVWLQSEEKPLFPNLYVLLIAPPGIGKGLTINPISEFLRSFKLHEQTKPVTGEFKPLNAEEAANYALLKQMQDRVEELNEKTSKKTRTPLLFPCSPDDITYEELVHQIAYHIRRINVDPCPMAKSGSYSHCSLAMMLEEMATLFKRQSEKAMKFLLKSFDCGDYEYATKTQGDDVIKRCCLNLLAGTTPSQIREMVDQQIVGDGFTSRCIILYAECERFPVFGIRRFEVDQLNAKAELLGHLKTLSKIFGQIEYDEDTYEYLRDYFLTGKHKTNHAEILQPYFQRKNIHVPKLATAIHFAEVDIKFNGSKPIFDNRIHLNEAQRAVKLLEAVEPKMSLALKFKEKNPIAQVSSKIVTALKVEPKTKRELLILLWEELHNGVDSLEEAIRYLVQIDMIVFDKDKYKLKTIE